MGRVAIVVKRCAGTYLQHQGLDLKVLNFNGHSALHKADNLQL
jgi:hypothetical protein